MGDWEMIWCPDDERSWLVRSKGKYPYNEFNIIEDGEVYCTGLIIDISARKNIGSIKMV